ncbi:septal ring lytic transglycosylase RlpA family protein [Fulvivirga lutimaris]|uniref:septal ring lytic transglycosylase RlpA family protein n=1 Tax=Fulvivirga lutimaris TaxID=1819566 RepID=UPI0012BB828C|nr:septal ring lytic transglycosylase RlpA family protein [Fulvivirga lutimaris]MTI39807.1 septal ring lytic transglycosylase RlpA family protein [Fulvivirga lutimaris]
MNPRLIISAVLLLLVVSVKAQIQEGKASYYADKFEGKPTASGEKYKHSKLTAAHKTLPFGTVVRVTSISNGKSVEVTINDRGPFVEGRVIDLSRSAAEKIGLIHVGIADVKIEVIDAGDGKGSGPTKPIGHVVVDEKEFYEFDVDRINPNGFGIQIGTFRELANLVRLADNLKSSYQKEVTVQVKLINGVKVYTIIVGDFKNREKATDFKVKLQQRYPDAFIVEFDKI